MNRIIIIAALIVLVSCSETMTVDEEYQHPEIVINGIFCLEDDTLDFFVTETREVFGYDLNYEDDLDVELVLLENGAPVGVFFKANAVVSNDNYGSGYGTHYQMSVDNIDTAVAYHFQVEHPTMGIASADASFPTKVNVESVELKEEKVRAEYGAVYNALVAYVTFTDPGGEDNFYQMQGGYLISGSVREVLVFDDLNKLSYSIPTDTIVYSTRLFPSSNQQVDPLIKPNEADFLVYSENVFQVFSDDVIDGETYTLRYVVDMSYSTTSNVYDIDTAAGSFVQAVINLRSIPKDLYLYYSTLDAFFWNDDSPFAEPVQVFSNVKNGVGIVAAYHNSERKGGIGSYPLPGKVYMTSSEYYNRGVSY